MGDKSKIKQVNDKESDYIVSVLELFEGQLSYDQILNMPIPDLHRLIDAKDRMIQAKVRARAEEEARQRAAQNQQPAGLYPNHKK